MASTKTKVASALFLFSFSMWLAIIWSVCFPNGAWANPVQFPTSTSFPLFIVSAAASSIACMIIGFDFIGMGNLRIEEARISMEKPQNQLPIQTSFDSIENNSSIGGNYRVLFNLEDQAENVSMLLLAKSSNLLNNALKVESPKRITSQRRRNPKTKGFVKAWNPETYVDTGEFEPEEKLKSKS